ncbi:MAG: cobalamin biosynthesis protein CobD [Chloroflexi bacterium]|nr:cobalamin biosynthesis protein CobD [Chloroflexota bacterium]
MLGEAAAVLALALVLELIVSDPRTRWHPVALFGSAVGIFVRLAPREGRARQLAYGALMVTAGAGGVTLGSVIALRWAGELNGMAATILGAVLLKFSFSYRQLEQEALLVASQVEQDALGTARASLRALVGRDTRDLSASLAASAAIESIAENLSDSFVAPLLFYALFGVPGALAYRAINTFDAMIGYHGPYEYLGRFSARIDDVANVVPARLTALLLVVAAAATGADGRSAFRTALRDHARTESPNAGWPMAAMAGALNVELEKTDSYVLGDPRTERTPGRVREAVRVARWAAVLTAALTLAASGPGG